MSLNTYDLFQPCQALFLGPSIDRGPKPCILYFSLSARESLSLDPYNQPARCVASGDCRIFSITLPGHHEGQDKFKAMAYWSKHLDELNTFIENVHLFIDHLVKENVAPSKQIGTMGLSRGGLIATHLATHEAVIATLGFAPVTNLKALEEFSNLDDPTILDTLSLENQLDYLVDKKVRYYIGNRDVRVNTRSAYDFVEKLAEHAYQKRIRSPHVELYITPSVGQSGHGTLPHTFKEGAEWLKKQIVK